MLALSVIKSWNIAQFDISTAFFNGKIEKQVFIEAPAGLTVASSKCLKLEKKPYMA